MSKEKILAVPNAPTPNNPVLFNPDICNGCNHCVEICPIDVYIPNSEKGKPPIILHPEECWYCGSCVNDCPRPGANTFNWALQHRGYWKNKETGKITRAGNPDPGCCR